MTKTSEIDRVANFLRGVREAIRPGFRYTTRGGYRMVALGAMNDMGWFDACNADLDNHPMRAHAGDIAQDENGRPQFGEW